MINSVIATNIFLSNLKAFGVGGEMSKPMASALGGGASSYLLGITVNSIDVGTAGAGTGFGFSVLLKSESILPSMLSSMSSLNMNGVMKQNMAMALSESYSSLLLSANSITTHAGVGVGTGKVTLSPNTPLHISSLVSSLKSSGIDGVNVKELSTAIALGVDAVLPSAISITVINGPPSPSPAVGVGIGKLI